jgi:S1-C subfamily serine protease
VFVKVDRPVASRPSRGAARVFTGTIPDYASDVKGLRLTSVVGGGPADKAGLEKGDVIVEVAGQSIANIYDYTYALETLKPAVGVKVVYTRGSERRETTLTPAARN